MQAAFRIARSRILIDALLDIAELKQDGILATTLRIVHTELVQASQSLAITRIPTHRFAVTTGVGQWPTELNDRIEDAALSAGPCEALTPLCQPQGPGFGAGAGREQAQL